MYLIKWIFRCGFVCFFCINSIFALTCPPSFLIKTVSFATAHPHKNDKELWYLLSHPFIYENISWNVSFGTFYTNVHNEKEALEAGTLFFESAHLKRDKPKPIWIPRGVFCDYMPEGEVFFVSALSPPINTP